KIEKQYHDKNIEFVSISIDKKPQHGAWKAMVKEKELGGVQLFADNNWGSQFIVDYGIRGIPRFILIDPEGKIVSASAPRPSDPKLVEVFNELSI
uniref:TlpA family protein disulfide reductase n=1 Tax=Aquimarina megaterium TaxID=1443666 RepID=UPI0005545A9E